MDDDKQWLTYWLTFGLFSILDSTFGFFLNYLPFYWLIRLLLIIWLQNPMTEGGLKVYKSVIHPFASKNKAAIDEVNK